MRTIEDADRIFSALDDATNLHLKCYVWHTRAVYLDLFVYKSNRFPTEKRLDLKLFLKLTNKMLYLLVQINHLARMETGVFQGEAIRLLRKRNSKPIGLRPHLSCSRALLPRTAREE